MMWVMARTVVHAREVKTLRFWHPLSVRFPAIYEIYEIDLSMNVYTAVRRVASRLTACSHAAASALTLTPLTLTVAAFGIVRR